MQTGRQPCDAEDNHDARKTGEGRDAQFLGEGEAGEIENANRDGNY